MSERRTLHGHTNVTFEGLTLGKGKCRWCWKFQGLAAFSTHLATSPVFKKYGTFKLKRLNISTNWNEYIQKNL